MNKHYSDNIFSALILIALGTILLFNNLGVLPWSIWITILRFWPVLLIIGGLQLIFGRTPFLRFLISLLEAAIIGIVLAISVATVNQDIDQWFNKKFPAIIQIRNTINLSDFGMGPKRSENITVSGDNFPSVEKRKLKMEFGAGEFNINDDDSTNFFKLDATYYGDSGKPKVATKVSANEIAINVNTEQHIEGLFGPTNELEYLVTIGKVDTPTNIDIKLGAGSLISEFTKLKITNLKLDIGAGNTSIDMNEPSLPDSADINIGAGKINFKVPKDIGFKVNYSVGLGKLQIGDKEFHGNGTFTSDNYENSSKKSDFTIKVGAGQATFVYE